MVKEVPARRVEARGWRMVPLSNVYFCDHPGPVVCSLTVVMFVPCALSCHFAGGRLSFSRLVVGVLGAALQERFCVR